MQFVEQKQKLDIDFQSIERMLSHLSGLLNISVDIKNPDGETMMCSDDRTLRMGCLIRDAATGTCGADRLDLFRQVEKSGKRTVQTKYEDTEIIGIPIECNKELVGILCACSGAGEGSMLHRAEAFLEEIANRISYEIENQFETEYLTRELSDRYEEVNLIYDVGKEIGRIGASEKAVKFIAEHSQQALETDAAVVYVPERDILEVVCPASSGLPYNIHDTSLIAEIYEVIVKRSSLADLMTVHIVLDRTCVDTLPVELLNGATEILAAPIKLKASLSGTLFIINVNRQSAFDRGDMRMLTSLAEQISMVITNAELYQNLKDFLLNMIKTLVYSIEAKDAYTRGHAERVSTLVMKIAEEMDLSPESKEALSWAAILHDIGKIGVPEKILNKAGKLTEEEFRCMKEHSEKGYEILKPIDQLNDSLSAIRHHHERYDGTGYPSGLKGEEIPLYARIIALADTYDAMTSTRSYRANRSHEDAIAEIVSVKGKQLDPELVDIFIKLSESISSL